MIAAADVGSAVVGALLPHPGVRSVTLVGSRAGSKNVQLSDWDFEVIAHDLQPLILDLPSLVSSLEPLTQQWDRLGPTDYSCYMLLLAGPRKIDLIFPGLPHRPAQPWVVTPQTLTAIDRHFWDWIYWLCAKQQAGKRALVQDQLRQMSEHLLRPMGVEAVPASNLEAMDRYQEARGGAEARSGVRVPRIAEDAVAPIVVTGGSPDP